MVSLLIVLFFKEYKKEYVIYVVLISSILILFISIEHLKDIVGFVKEIAEFDFYNIDFIKILLKVTGISIILEYAISICEDCGEKVIASKIDLGGKIILISMSIPVISSTAKVLTDLISY